MRIILATLLFTAAGLAFPAFSSADDWPQWMGPERDDVWRETGILTKFPEAGAKVLWRAPVAGGFAGPAVADGRVYVADYLRKEGDPAPDPGKRNKLTGLERLLCFDQRSGKLLWKHEYDCPYEVSYPAGPRVTPTAHQGKVYSLGTEGNLYCLDTADGRVIWSKELKKEYKTTTPQWGFCGHPLIDGKKLICLVGGEGSVAVAFDKDTGKELWRALSASEPGYCPPTIIEAGGKRQLLIWHATALNSLDPETGKLYWEHPLKPDYGMSITAPRKLGDLLYASGIGNVCVCLRLAKEKPGVDEVWRGTTKTGVYCANSTPFLDGGIIYGSDCQVGCLRGVKLDTGARLWETFQPTTGGNERASSATAFIIKNDDRFFLFSETGHLIIAKLSPKGYEEVSRAKLLEPTGDAFGRPVVWSHPAFAGKCCFARNDKELVCVSLAGE
jgi:outer membrane protein assembly factor BamB